MLKNFERNTDREKIRIAQSSANEQKCAAMALRERLKRKRESQGLSSFWHEATEMGSSIDIRGWDDYCDSERELLMKEIHTKIWCKVSVNPFNIDEADGKILINANYMEEGRSYRVWETVSLKVHHADSFCAIPHHLCVFLSFAIP